MMIFKLILSFYEMIQNIIGYVEFKTYDLKIDHRFKTCNIVYINHFDSHVLGKWVFINPETDDKIILRHEYGHRIQSYILGPLYIFVIYIPSYLHYIWFSNQNKENWDEYYNFFTEKSANELSRKR